MTGEAVSPAMRYAAFRRRQAQPELASFEGGYPFGLDPFQRTACSALEDGRGVLVAAPTGAGKTVVAEFAVHLALARGGKCFYTTPIKALSNQKFADLRARHGEDRVGLLTGDTSINGSADVVVMTTEVLRNMLYSGSEALRGLSHVVMDEVHYLADRARGAVWEEVIIHLPQEVTLVSLSATVSNAEEFGDWLVTVRGRTEVVVEEHRPVPLWQHVMVGTRLLDLFVDAAAAAGPCSPELRVNPRLLRLTGQVDRAGTADGRSAGERSGPRRRPPSRPDVLAQLDREGLLPAITFVFSRAGCDAAVGQCLRSGLRLTTEEEAEHVRRHVAARTGQLSRQDLRVLGYWDWLEGLQRGVAAHHAGMLPTFKQVVEELFTAGLVKAVFATETLALGVNMPARSVVLERLVKWNGQAHADVTPGEYTQLTGRAGRRGIDVEGHAVVLWQPDLDPRQVAGLASTRTYPLRSSFRPTYNMAVNLVGQFGRERARALLELSFAQFQADRSVVGLARQVARNVEALQGYREAMTCEFGDAEQYAQLRQGIKRRETDLARQGSADRRAAAAQSLERLRPGDVIRVPGGRRSGLAAVVDPGAGPPGPAHPLVVTEDRWAGRLSAADFPGPVQVVGRIRLPRGVNVRSPQVRRDLASSIRNLDVPAADRRGGRRRTAAGSDGQLTDLRTALRRHPVHGCPDRETHLRWAERWRRLRADTDALERQVQGKTSSVARTFDRVCAVLDRLGYLDGDRVTDPGRQLAGVYSESDLLVVECLRSGLLSGLRSDELAAVVSALVYESRRPEPAWPAVGSARVQAALAAAERLWHHLSAVEQAAKVQFVRAPDPGFCEAARRWAGGAGLAEVLDADGELTAGDFVRWCRQLVDLLDQIAAVAAGTGDTALRDTARAAITAVRRGVVDVAAAE